MIWTKFPEPEVSPKRNELAALLAVTSALAVTVPAVKFPDASRRTIVEAVLLEVAALAKLAPEATLAAVTPPTEETTVADCVPVTSPAKLPEKLVAEVAVVAFPDKLAVMVPALKFPDASLRTIVEAVLAEVAALARTVAAATLVAV